MSAEPLSVPQQATRFVLVGGFVFVAMFWAAGSALMTPAQAHTNQLALKAIIKGLTTEPFALWVSDLETGYVPFFLAQRALVGCYAISTPFAWLAAYWFDTKIQRKEKKL